MFCFDAIWLDITVSIATVVPNKIETIHHNPQNPPHTHTHTLLLSCTPECIYVVTWSPVPSCAGFMFLKKINSTSVKADKVLFLFFIFSAEVLTTPVIG